ncbi:MAG: hypothetical protein PHP42_13920 [Bacteroidota bacterium]|nr:hypothetical protein [Bacteroidota bacterium]
MASGDAARVWFPEMLDDLKEKWGKSMDWASVISLCNEMTEAREMIRKEKGIKPAKFKCKNCAGNMVLPPVSVRSLLFALMKVGKIKKETFDKLDKNWKSYQRKNKLDGYGNKKIKSQEI